MARNKTKYKTEGLVRLDIDLDVKTYTFLLALVEKSGYSLDLDSRQKSEGIRGVVTQGIVELYQKYINVDDDESESEVEAGLDKINQQAYIFANRAKAIGRLAQKNGVTTEDVVNTLKPKLPAYLKKHKTGKLFAKDTMKKFVKASTFSDIALPELTQDIEKELDAKDILKYME